MPTEGYTEFCKQWLEDVTAGSPSTSELGRRFARKIFTQWLDIDESTDEIVYCDGSGDGGIDVAYLQRGEPDEGQEAATVSGDTWYLVQSKYGSAFVGKQTLLLEGQKVLETLGGTRPKLSSLAEGLLARLKGFLGAASERDRLVLVYATVDPLTPDEQTVLKDIRNIGAGRLGAVFDVEAVSLETIHQRVLETPAAKEIAIKVKGGFTTAADLIVGSIPLLAVYDFMRQYRDQTQDLDQLYEKNVRRFLGGRGKVNKGMRGTLSESPDKFGLYNNGITLVASDAKVLEDGTAVLTDPFIVNGCQTTRSIWEVFHQKLATGGTGKDAAREEWVAKAERGVVIAKIVKVATADADMLEHITRYTNSQNAVREKDFIALTSDFRTWSREMADKYGVFLEIQRGGWDSQLARQKAKPSVRQFKHHANAFDLLKVYSAGWLSEAGLAYGKNAPFLPNGSVFKKVIANDEDGGFGVDDLYASYVLMQEADAKKFGRGAEKVMRRQTRFLFYYVTIQLLKDILVRNNVDHSRRGLSKALLVLAREDNSAVRAGLIDIAVDAVDEYLTQDAEDSVFKEPAYINTFNSDLGGFLKSEKFPKSEETCPRLRSLLSGYQKALGMKKGTAPSTRDAVIAVVKKG